MVELLRIDEVVLHLLIIYHLQILGSCNNLMVNLYPLGVWLIFLEFIGSVLVGMCSRGMISS